MDRRSALIDAAFTCIAERGFEGLRLRVVAADAGIDHSTLHHYFATKDDLVAAVLQHLTQRFSIARPPGRTPPERLHHHLAALARLIREQPALFTVLAEFDLHGRRNPAVRMAIARDEAGWRAALEGLWRQGGEAGAWAVRLEPPAAAELIIATVKGARLLPDQAGPVLAALERALLKRPVSDLPPAD